MITMMNNKSNNKNRKKKNNKIRIKNQKWNNVNYQILFMNLLEINQVINVKYKTNNHNNNHNQNHNNNQILNRKNKIK